MSKLVTTPYTKAKAGVKSAVASPTRFLVSLGFGFVIGVITQLVTEYLAYVYSKMAEKPLPNAEIGFSIYYKHPEIMWIPFNDFICIIIGIFMLFTRKFVLTLGYNLGWYVSSNEGLFYALHIPPP